MYIDDDDDDMCVSVCVVLMASSIAVHFIETGFLFEPGACQFQQTYLVSSPYCSPLRIGISGNCYANLGFMGGEDMIYSSHTSTASTLSTEPSCKPHHKYIIFVIVISKSKLGPGCISPRCSRRVLCSCYVILNS